ncbi:MAG: N-acetyltransferase family protein [Azoarcus sp.]|nr:N-acetyltransferase family protein [Azoarcus sp.]
MQLVDCSPERHAGAILDLLNDAIMHSTALYEYSPRPPQSMDAWFAGKREGGFPVIGLEDDDGRLAGFASYGSFRAYPAFKYSVEHSVYVHADHRGRGVGRTLLQALIERARQHQRHLLVGAIDAGNAASIALHASLGFVHAGTLPQAGYKFGRWLDLAFYQLTLDTPTAPVDG